MDLAEVLVGCEELVDNLLRKHVPDRTGHCVACIYYQRPPPTHPCRISDAAARARQMRQEKK